MGRRASTCTASFKRFYPSRELARPIIGGLLPDRGEGGAGLELSLDSVLSGTPGESVMLKDRAGRRYDSPARRIREPVPGNDVVLTIDTELQEIAERGLANALDSMQAEGGDIVFLDPKTGELLALASHQVRAGTVPRASTFTDPFEPGSTAKLFTAAALLQLGLVDSTDEVFGENGHWLMPVNRQGRTRPLTDVHVHRGNVTLSEAIRTSSNIAMAKFSMRLSPEQQYDMLRDFGFGTSDRRGVSFRVARGAGTAPALGAHVHAGQHGHRLRAERDASAARGGVWSHRQRRHPDGPDPRA